MRRVEEGTRVIIQSDPGAVSGSSSKFCNYISGRVRYCGAPCKCGFVKRNSLQVGLAREKLLSRDIVTRGREDRFLVRFYVWLHPHHVTGSQAFHDIFLRAVTFSFASHERHFFF
jgi:hypothetical protein